MITSIRLATSNVHKAREIEQVLGIAVERVPLDLTEVQALDVSAVIEAKAREAYARTGVPILVEDTGLYFAAWNGLPGALVSWFMKTVDSAGLCRMLRPGDTRAAVARTAIGFFDGTEFHAFLGELAGSVAGEPRGTNGFGWDTLFIPDGSARTMAEMTADEKNALSMRAAAAKELRAFLDTRPGVFG
jgi:XTP/dITP diphosphohydrolase